MSKSDETPEKFNKVCNILSEYALQKSCTPAVEAFFGEHYRMLLSGIIEDAIVIKQNELSYILCMTAHFKYKDHYARSLAKKSLISFTNASGSIP